MANRLLTVFFIAGTVYFWSAVYSVSAQSLDYLQKQLTEVKAAGFENTIEIKLLAAETDRNKRDIQQLASTVANLAESINKLSGIGMAIGGIGTLIFIFQSVSLVRHRKQGA